MKKIREELDLVPMGDIPDDILNNYLFITSDGFCIVDDYTGLKKELGFTGEELDEFLDERFDSNWGISEDWTDCSYCGKAIYLSSYYGNDYALIAESGFYCSDCIKNVPEIRDAYLEDLTNDPDKCNEFLSEDELRAAGLIKLEGRYGYGYFNGSTDNPRRVLTLLLTRFPNGKFIFDLLNSNRYAVEYSVWAYPGYEEGAIEYEEE